MSYDKFSRAARIVQQGLVKSAGPAVQMADAGPNNPVKPAAPKPRDYAAEQAFRRAQTPSGKVFSPDSESAKTHVATADTPAPKGSAPAAKAPAVAAKPPAAAPAVAAKPPAAAPAKAPATAAKPPASAPAGKPAAPKQAPVWDAKMTEFVNKRNALEAGGSRKGSTAWEANQKELNTYYAGLKAPKTGAKPATAMAQAKPPVAPAQPAPAPKPAPAQAGTPVAAAAQSAVTSVASAAAKPIPAPAAASPTPAAVSPTPAVASPTPAVASPTPAPAADPAAAPKQTARAQLEQKVFSDAKRFGIDVNKPGALDAVLRARETERKQAYAAQKVPGTALASNTPPR